MFTVLALQTDWKKIALTAGICERFGYTPFWRMREDALWVKLCVLVLPSHSVFSSYSANGTRLTYTHTLMKQLSMSEPTTISICRDSYINTCIYINIQTHAHVNLSWILLNTVCMSHTMNPYTCTLTKTFGHYVVRKVRMYVCSRSFSLFASYVSHILQTHTRKWRCAHTHTNTLTHTNTIPHTDIDIVEEIKPY